ncbi:NUDIX domain-containing protein [Vibrio hannami]|uniref:NUDIX hydrolase n=1 Tax=Vibrio hannami TaxID=2717094 RepID=UPI0024104A49|nr:NUDIX domain-containing protein [Vibrio hannami]MDG3085288.1 NUDIX domain-containing protein [Vibrio hannami]
MKHFESPLFTVDSALFTVHEGQLQVLAVRRAINPYQGSWALPGGYVDMNLDSNVEDTALRKLKDKTGIHPAYLEQLQTFSGTERDPRGFSVTLAYYALIGYQDAKTYIDTVSEATWLPVKQLSEYQLAFDHEEIVSIAVERLRQKALYSMVPVFCLSEQFTVAELKSTIEAIIDKPIQRKTLIRRIEASSMFEAVEEKVQTGRRPATQYRLKEGADIHHFERNLS